MSAAGRLDKLEAPKDFFPHFLIPLLLLLDTERAPSCPSWHMGITLFRGRATSWHNLH